MAVRKSNRRVLLLLLVLVNTLTISWCQDFEECARQITCGNCTNLGAGGCAWCTQENFMPRCQPMANLTASSCIEPAIENPMSEIDSMTETGDDAPISLSNIQLNLRVGDPQTFTVTVTPQRNLPLDLYILIDLSGSMGDELATIQSVASRISTQIVNVTNNIRLGFGAFNDKFIQPFSYNTLNINGPPFPDLGLTLRHIVDFTDNSTSFSDQVNIVETTVNVDRPENGLEALAQVITCQDIIGWRSETRGVGSRVVLFMTDQEFHFAGEGRLAGILTPYNGECLLDTDGSYPAFADYDFPSVGQILELLAENSVTTIFAIQEDRINSYETLANTILNANAIRAVTASFRVDISNAEAERLILGLIEDEYRRILQAVSLDFSDISTNVSIVATATCPPSSTPVASMDSCQAVPLDSDVDFNVVVTLNSCEGLQHKVPIEHTVSSPSFGTFDLSILPICNCECAEEDGDRSMCSGNGTPRCGVCECDFGYCGDMCNIPIGDRNALDCPMGENGLRCSGRGTCDCNCICNQPDDFPAQRIFGEACECDTFSCLRPGDQEICSGRGDCCNGECMCDDSPLGNPYRGDNNTGIESCQCEPEDEVCRDPENRDVLCNGRGVCGCNFCDCVFDRTYTGTFCDVLDVGECNHPADEMCIRECRDSFSDLPDICSLMCARRRPLLFVDMEENTGSAALEVITNRRLNATNSTRPGREFSTQSVLCEFVDDGCTTEYYVLQNETHFALVVIREQTCVGFVLPIPLWALAPIILGGLLILGILIMILIKIIFVILDYVEVKKWEKDARTADFSKNTNPLYQSPEMKYENVAYGRE